MATYAFHIKCTLSEEFSATKDCEVPLELPAPAGPIKARLTQGKGGTGSSLSLRCGGFESEAGARVAGVPVKTAVMLTGVLLGAGIDVGDDQAVSDALQQSDEQLSEQFQPDLNGLQVVPEIKGKPFLSVRFGRPVFKDDSWVGRFQEHVVETYAPGRPLTKRQTLAAKLCNLSYFLTSDIARFVTLITAVEALVDQASSPSATRASVDCMLAMVQADTDLEPSEREVLKSRLGSLKQESIGSACRAVVLAHCGEAAAEAFPRLYGIRSRWLHLGEPPSGTDLPADLRKLESLVSELVVRHVASG
jgi:hypothetical protein